MKDPENALRAFKQATFLSPDDPIVLLNSTACLVNCGLKKEAVEVLNRYRDLQASGKISTVVEEVSAYVGADFTFVPCDYELDELLPVYEPNVYVFTHY